MKEACSAMGMSQATVSTWKTRESLPSGEIAIKIADYFNVTTDVVLGHNDMKSRKSIDIDVSDTEMKLLNLFRNDKDFKTLLRLTKFSYLLKKGVTTLS